jgi:uncharacterized protein
MMRRHAAAVAAVLFVLAGTARAQQPLQIPAPRGHVNDFASVIGSAERQAIELLARFVRERSGGEIAVVTLPDIGTRDVATVALEIGREWKVGAKAEIGDRRRNTGIVVLLVPKETSSDGDGHVSIMVGNGAEGFIPDAVAGDIRRAGTVYFAQRAYGRGLEVITALIAERYATEFGFSLDSAGVTIAPQPRRARSRRGISTSYSVIMLIIVIAILSRGRRGGRSGCGPFIAGQILGQAMGRHGRYGGGGGFGGGFGGGGGGFGGFGGGGGFSGGGSSGSF